MLAALWRPGQNSGLFGAFGFLIGTAIAGEIAVGIVAERRSVKPARTKIPSHVGPVECHHLVGRVERLQVTVTVISYH
jgi:hypothetical protein